MACWISSFGSGVADSADVEESQSIKSEQSARNEVGRLIIIPIIFPMSSLLA